MNTLLTLILVGLSVGLGNFAASIAIGLSGASKSTRWRTALTFGLFETGMPILGLVLGQRAAGVLGHNANLIGGGLLILTGGYIIIGALKQADDAEVKQAESGGLLKLLLTALALSIDNLIVGFSLGARHLPLALTAIVVGIISVLLALLGLELGSRLGKKFEEYSEAASGIILILVGIAVIFQLL